MSDQPEDHVSFASQGKRQVIKWTICLAIIGAMVAGLKSAIDHVQEAAARSH